jgi:hypothetical protein
MMPFCVLNFCDLIYALIYELILPNTRANSIENNYK